MIFIIVFFITKIRKQLAKLLLNVILAEFFLLLFNYYIVIFG